MVEINKEFNFMNNETTDSLDYIFKRRSIRKYLDKDVEKDKLELLLKAAMAAPTAANKQPEPRTQYNEKRVYWQEYEPTRKHRARPKNMKDL